MRGRLRDAADRYLAQCFAVGTPPQVLAIADGRPLSRVSAADGSFRFRGLQPGKVRTRAENPHTGQYSSILHLDVPAEGKIEGVELKLGELRKATGRVTSAGAPVVGARVLAYAFVDGAAQQARAVTGLEGGFELSIPASSAAVNFIVGAPGRTLHAFRLPGKDPVTLDIAPRGGLLRLRYPAEGGTIRVLFNDTVAIPFHDLVDWARAQRVSREEGAMLVPEVAAGKYRICLSDRCAEGSLTTGGTLDLSVVR